MEQPPALPDAPERESDAQDAQSQASDETWGEAVQEVMDLQTRVPDVALLLETSGKPAVLVNDRSPPSHDDHRPVVAPAATGDGATVVEGEAMLGRQAAKATGWTAILAGNMLPRFIGGVGGGGVATGATSAAAAETADPARKRTSTPASLYASPALSPSMLSSTEAAAKSGAGAASKTGPTHSNYQVQCQLFPTYATRQLPTAGQEGADFSWTVRIYGWLFTDGKLESAAKEASPEAGPSGKAQVELATSPEQRSDVATPEEEKTENHSPPPSPEKQWRDRMRFFMMRNVKDHGVDVCAVGVDLHKPRRTLVFQDPTELHHGAPTTIDADLKQPHTRVTSTETGQFKADLKISHQLVQAWTKQALSAENRPVDEDAKRKWIRLHAIRNASEAMLCSGRVQVLEPEGISVISDIDDTVKHTQILRGKIHVLLNTFFEEAKPVEGMAELYQKWYKADARNAFHFVSNSPWQTLPMLQSFFRRFSFPPGSVHLKLFDWRDKKYRKTLTQLPWVGKLAACKEIFADFPHRKFILVGDSGEMDMELYMMLYREFPEQVSRILIRDVTTTAQRKPSTSDPGSKPSASKQEALTALPAVDTMDVVPLSVGAQPLMVDAAGLQRTATVSSAASSTSSPMIDRARSFGSAIKSYIVSPKPSRPPSPLREQEGVAASASKPAAKVKKTKDMLFQERVAKNFTGFDPTRFHVFRTTAEIEGVMGEVLAELATAREADVQVISSS